MDVESYKKGWNSGLEALTRLANIVPPVIPWILKLIPAWQIRLGQY